MRFMIRQIEEQAKLPDEIPLDALGAAVPHAVVKAVVAELGVAEHRRRQLPAEVGLLLSVAMNLCTQDSRDHGLVKLRKGLRFIWPDPTFVPASKGAVCQARDRLGAHPTVALFHRVCQPMATIATPGAFLFGLRLLALDGSPEDVPDTRAHGSVCGRHPGPRGASAFPQVQGVYLLEGGTHAIVDAGFWPCHTSERLGGRRLLCSVTAGRLRRWDRGLHSFDMAQRPRARGAHFLGRVRADTVTDLALPGDGERHRLITSVLEAEPSPALELSCAYHARWEIELAIDEIDTQQRLVRHPWRSQKPVGVIQAL